MEYLCYVGIAALAVVVGYAVLRFVRFCEWLRELGKSVKWHREKLSKVDKHLGMEHSWLDGIMGPLRAEDPRWHLINRVRELEKRFEPTSVPKKKAKGA